MIDIQQLITSGIIEEYCLGIANEIDTQTIENLRLQYPEIEAEIAAMQTALMRYATPVLQPTPSADLKQNIMSTLHNLQLEKEFDLNNLPEINRYTDTKLWQLKLAHISPPDIFDNIHSHRIYSKEGRKMYLVWLKTSLKEDMHDDCHETFILLEGECYFRSGDTTTFYKAGDYITVPDVEHEVVVTSSTPLKFIVQRLAKAS